MTIDGSKYNQLTKTSLIISWICPHCTAVVVHPSAHEKWHKSLKKGKK